MHFHTDQHLIGVPWIKPLYAGLGVARSRNWHNGPAAMALFWDFMSVSKQSHDREQKRRGGASPQNTYLIDPGSSANEPHLCVPAILMASKRKKKSAGTRVIRTRDPYWRVRRALGTSRVENRKAHRRSSSRAVARKVMDDC